MASMLPRVIEIGHGEYNNIRHNQQLRPTTVPLFQQCATQVKYKVTTVGRVGEYRQVMRNNKVMAKPVNRGSA